MGKDLEILYEDNHIIVVVKPFNILSQADNTKDCDMLTIIKQYLKEKYNKPGNVYLGLVHRLDRPTGGIMVFAKTSKAAKRLSEDIKNDKFHKEYLAIIHGILKEKEGTLENYLLRLDNKKTIVTTKEKGKIAILSYKVLESKNNLTLVKIALKTGRHHQIRVQFSNINHPLYGDQKYGIKDNKQLALYAYKLSFKNPVTKNNLTFIKYPKKVGIWKEFNMEGENNE